MFVPKHLRFGLFNRRDGFGKINDILPDKSQEDISEFRSPKIGGNPGGVFQE
ncbi:MAG: hypothetical protein OZSIB_1288 [Candidatus Ozemobacter sibiricus]|uniref:Uncharacterized protein n=1 Tax=Candidatus Ozemobacter sibiricus TaxID=2268124 RepID=A0A367ZKD9_9BACT|nr:MAG: hypothetical protein OZSIB_1288 [Candidatus Ozemobacter sibiricus]